MKSYESKELGLNHDTYNTETDNKSIEKNSYKE